MTLKEIYMSMFSREENPDWGFCPTASQMPEFQMRNEKADISVRRGQEMALLSLVIHNELGHQVLKCKADVRV